MTSFVDGLAFRTKLRKLDFDLLLIFEEVYRRGNSSEAKCDRLLSPYAEMRWMQCQEDMPSRPAGHNQGSASFTS
jgi:hypothetical protein